MYPAPHPKCLDICTHTQSHTHPHIHINTLTHGGKGQPLELDLHRAFSCLRSDYLSPHGTSPLLGGGHRGERGCPFHLQTIGPSALVLLSKTGCFVWKTRGSGANTVTTDLHGQQDAEAHLTEFIVSQTLSIKHGVSAVPLGPVTQSSLSLKVCFISFSEKLKHGVPVVYAF